MTTPDLASPPDRILVVGPRELDVLRLLWADGPATVRQLHTALITDPPISYNTLQTVCLHLTNKGLLTRRPATELRGHPYMFEPTIGPATFTHVMVGRTRRLIAPYPADQSPAAPHNTTTDESDTDMLAALRERVATAEQAAILWESAAHRAERRIKALERRAKAAERRAEQAERAVQRLTAQLNRPPRATPHPPHEVIIEHRNETGICRVCGAPAPPPFKSRKDGLRVCRAESCRA
jgi:BlaI family penicillinase repressor